MGIAKKDIDLVSLVDFNAIMDIQGKLAKLVSVPTVTVDIKGNPLKLSNFSLFCQLIRSSPKGRKKCINCDAEAGFTAIEQNNEPRTYHCHAGLIDCVAPIIVDGHFLGSVLGGQVLIKGEHTRNCIDIERISYEFEIPIELLKGAVKDIPLVTRDYLQNYVDFYNFLSSYIAQMGMHRITQEQLLVQTREKFKLEQQTKKMELSTIKAQIQPHFLFNTLNTIARLAIIEEAPQTEELIYNLSDMLRYNLKNIEDLPRIREEIENIKKYLFIQTLRYSDRIGYRIQIDEAILDYRIPAMVLQPIIENALYHGLETKKEGGEVLITGKVWSENNLLITISDNGKGIDPKLLQILNNAHSTCEISQKLGIGIKNPNSRIKHLFGKEYGITIESTINVGTSVFIHIPCVR